MEDLFCPTNFPNLANLIDLQYAPRLLFYSYVPIAIVAILLGFFVYFKDHQSLKSKLLLSVSTCFSLLVINEIAQWVVVYGRVVFFSWQLSGLLQVAVIAQLFYFVYVFLYDKDLTWRLKAWLSLAISPIILLLSTSWNMAALDLATCEGVNGYLWTYIYILQIILGVMAVAICLHEFFYEEKNSQRRTQTKLLSIGVAFFILFFVGTTVASDSLLTYEINLLGPIGTVTFLGFLGYMIVKFRAFNIKMFATQALVWVLWIMIGAILFVAQTTATQIVTAITEVLAIFFGIMLIKSVKREVEQREELARLNQDLAAANVQLTDLNRQKSEFVSFASHDLKSPINIIKQFASLIADGTYKEPQKIQETVNKIKVNADRATALVDDFLDIRKIEEGHMDYAFEIKDIVSFVKAATEEYAPLAKAQKNIEVSFATSVAKANVKMDATRLRQVIQNLLSNSLKYSEKGSIKVTITEEQCTILITVKDTGLGMDKALLPILFEQFHRDASVAKKIQGTGLGLYISKQIVLAHGGEIWAESEGKGMGSTFTVRLPKA